MVMDAALDSGWTVVAVVDDAPVVHELLGVAVTRPGLPFRSPGEPAPGFIIGVGDNLTRARLFQRLLLEKMPAATVVHPDSSVSLGSIIGAGSFVAAGAVVVVGARVGVNSIVNTGASVDHDCLVGDHVHICPGVRLAGEVTVGDGVLLGTGACVLPKVRIGRQTIIGAGAVVREDVPPHSLAAGVPARVVRCLVPVNSPAEPGGTHA